MKTGTNPAVALLVGSLILGGLGGATSADGETAPGGINPAAVSAAIGAITQGGGIGAGDQVDLGQKIGALLQSLGPMAAAKARELVHGVRQENPVRQTKAQAKSAQDVKPAAPPQPRHIHLRRPDPTPPKTPQEQARVDADRAMYERIKAMNEAEDQAAVEPSDLVEAIADVEL